MAKRPTGTLLEIEISFSGNEPLHRQVYLAIKNAILHGRLRPGARLPSTRIIAGDLGLSRTTVLNAFDQLYAEGYVEGKARIRHASCVVYSRRSPRTGGENSSSFG